MAKTKDSSADTESGIESDIAELNDEMQKLAGEFAELWQSRITSMADTTRGSGGSESLSAGIEEAGLAWQKFMMEQMRPLFSGGDSDGSSSSTSSSSLSSFDELLRIVAELAARMEGIERRLRDLESRFNAE